jgi:hypothetical protein
VLRERGALQNGRIEDALLPHNIGELDLIVAPQRKSDNPSTITKPGHRVTARGDHHRPFPKTTVRAMMTRSACNAVAAPVEMTIIARSAVVPSAGERMAGIVVMGTRRRGASMTDATRGAARTISLWMLTGRCQMTFHQDRGRVVDASGTDLSAAGAAVRVRKEVATENHREDVVGAVEVIAQLIAARMMMNRIGEVVESTAIVLAEGGTEVDQTAAMKATLKSVPRRSGKIDERAMGTIEGKVMVIERIAAGIVTKATEGRICPQAA